MRMRSCSTPTIPPAVADSAKEIPMTLTGPEATVLIFVLLTVIVIFALASHHELEKKRLSTGYYKHINQRSDTTPPSAPCPRDSSPDTGTVKASRKSTGSGRAHRRPSVGQGGPTS